MLFLDGALDRPGRSFALGCFAPVPSAQSASCTRKAPSATGTRVPRVSRGPRRAEVARAFRRSRCLGTRALGVRRGPCARGSRRYDTFIASRAATATTGPRAAGDSDYSPPFRTGTSMPGLVETTTQFLQHLQHLQHCSFSLLLHAAECKGYGILALGPFSTFRRHVRTPTHPNAGQRDCPHPFPVRFSPCSSQRSRTEVFLANAMRRWPARGTAIGKDMRRSSEPDRS